MSRILDFRHNSCGGEGAEKHEQKSVQLSFAIGDGLTMPLRCLGPDGGNIQAFDLTDEQWRILRFENKKSRRLRMPCCPSPVVMKTSSLGTKFFAHSAKGCAAAPETEEHLLLKQIAAGAARKAGWNCTTEVAGSTPTGEGWTADVLAQKGKHKIAIEIQWSRQTAEETRYRQERYRQSGVRCLWLFRRSGFPISEALPAVCVGGDKSLGFDIRIPWDERVPPRDFNKPTRWAQIIPITEFFDAVFGKRFRYGAPVDAAAQVTVHSGVLECWKRQCQAETRIVTFIDVKVGPHEVQFDIRSLGRYPDLLSQILSRIPPTSQLGVIKRRYSRTLDESYISNGCYRCDALVGTHFEHDAWHSDNTMLASFPITVSDDWRDAIELQNGGSFGWAVHNQGQSET